MEWLEEVRAKEQKKNLVLFTQKNPLIQSLQQLVDQHTHRTVVLWAFDFADETVAKLQTKYPNEKRPQKAVELSKAWAAGQVKMPVAQRAILDAHAFAKEITSLEDIAYCHAVGQACGVVHTTGHAVGFPVYDLTALVRLHTVDGCKEIIERRVAEYFDKMLYWQEKYNDAQYTWADFMMKD